MSRALCRMAFTTMAAAALALSGSSLALAGDHDDPSNHSEWSGSAFFKTSSQQAGPTGASSTHTVSGAD
ncbi:hypothetical protein GCM10010156_24760 [Planobispora rosea]|uniref:Pectate lyase n=1 Tax=Planobispora rosea TaxID=35762 RepID=A0A8J3S2V2_PLARO|nr:hypothetical protein [Planobispora rosea]GGS64891.1 hypothetical protein GCM10010156_24760 [Planobispora rosea]GIH84837.1 hypothetical protein Pro02_32450 [Planobispora rosea]